MLIYGRNPVIEAAKAGKALKVFIRKGAALYDVSFDVPVTIMQKKEFDSRFHPDAQGIAAEIDDIEMMDLRDARGILEEAEGVVILDRIQDPHNYGAIIRSAHCFGVNTIIVPRYHQAPVTASVCKASAGAIFFVNIIETTNLAQAGAFLKEMGYTIAACDMDAEMSASQYEKKGKTALIVGSEGRGVRDGLVQAADVLIKIPMAGKIDSLNAAQSAAVALYEIFIR